MKVFCGKCGRECPEGVRFCPYCGQLLPELTEGAVAQPEPAVQVEPAAQAEVRPQPEQQVAAPAPGGRFRAALTKWSARIQAGLLFAVSLTVFLVTLFSGVTFTVTDAATGLSYPVRQTMFQTVDAAFSLGMDEEQARDFLKGYERDAQKIMQDLLGGIFDGGNLSEEALTAAYQKALSKLNVAKAQIAEAVLSGKESTMAARLPVLLMIPNLLLWFAAVVTSGISAGIAAARFAKNKPCKCAGYCKSVFALLAVQLLFYVFVPAYGAGAGLYVALSMLLVGVLLLVAFPHISGERELNAPGLIKTGALLTACLIAFFCLANGGVMLKTPAGNQFVFDRLVAIMFGDGSNNVEADNIFGGLVMVYLPPFYLAFTVSVCVTLIERLMKGEYCYDHMSKRVITAFVFTMLMIVMNIVYPILLEMKDVYLTASVYVAAVFLLFMIVFRGVMKVPTKRQTENAPPSGC